MCKKKNFKDKWKWLVLTFLLLAVLGIALYPLPPQEPIRYYDRHTKVLKTEKVAGEGWLLWLYNNPVGEISLDVLAKRKIVSSIYGRKMDAKSSIDKIEPFIRDFGVDMSIAEQQHFSSFNDFFIRKLKPGARPIDPNPNAVTSPADGKILVFDNIHNADFIIKGFKFNVSSFLDDKILAEKYKDGTLLIIRLAPPDYHRYHFPVSGRITHSKKIEGDYYSVSPAAIKRNTEIFWLNKREYTLISTNLFGDVVMSEVGATMVGTIVQTYKSINVVKGEEKGYFKFGGSTVVLLFEKGKIKVDQDLLQNSKKGIETAVNMGERIATKR